MYGKIENFLRINDVFGFIIDPLKVNNCRFLYIYRERGFSIQKVFFMLEKIKQAKKSVLLVRIVKVNESETECEI